MNSRPPPCEGDALPAELLPHMTPRCGVAWYVCHSGGRVKSFLRAGADAGWRVRARPRVPAGPGGGLPARSRRGPRALSSPANPSDRHGARPPLARCSRSFATSAEAFRQVPCAPDARRSSHGWRARIAHPCDWTRLLPAAFRNAGSDFPRIPKKIGRAAPAGLGSREKKRYRSPLVSP